MNASRLGRLASLTRGAAVVGIGIAGTACTKSEPQPPVINAPAPTTATATPPSPLTSESAQPVLVPEAPEPSSSVPIRRMPIPNAMPPGRWKRDAGDGG
jgi:hypothetical protein